MSKTPHALVLNCGSSSLKFAIINGQSGESIFSGLAECLGERDARLKWLFNNEKTKQDLPEGASHQQAIDSLVALIHQFELTELITAVGHRVVHGGETFTQSSLIDNDVKAAISKVAKLAPLHNPANLVGIEAAQKSFAELPQVAVFDTAFHQSMPEHAYLYALPKSLYRDHGVRRYGFHGTSHSYVSGEAAKMLQKPLEQTNVITAHLGNGCSVAAIKAGKSVDTSMGLTPLAGVVMGTRSGDIDPGIMYYLTETLNYSTQQLDNLLNKESGLKGLSEISNDCRTLEEAMFDGNQAAKLALDIFCYKLAKQIAAYMVAVGRLDALVFTGGIGENSDYIREQVINQLGFLGLELDDAANVAARFGAAGSICRNDGIQALVIPTNEEYVIASDALRLARLSEEK